MPLHVDGGGSLQPRGGDQLGKPYSKSIQPAYELLLNPVASSDSVSMQERTAYCCDDTVDSFCMRLEVPDKQHNFQSSRGYAVCNAECMHAVASRLAWAWCSIDCHLQGPEQLAASGPTAEHFVAAT